MPGPSPAVADLDRFVNSFEQLTLPSNLKVETLIEGTAGLRSKGFPEFLQRLKGKTRLKDDPAIEEAAALSAWDLMCDAMLKKEITTARKFLNALVALGFSPLEKDSARFFWNGYGNKLGVKQLHGKALDATTGKYRIDAVWMKEDNVVYQGQGKREVFTGNEMFSDRDRGQLKNIGQVEFPESLEGSDIPKLLDDLGPMMGLDWSVSIMVWGVISRLFAIHSQGNIVVVVNDGVMVGTVFWNDELPALRLLQRTFPDRITGIYIKVFNQLTGLFEPLLNLDENMDKIYFTGSRRFEPNPEGTATVPIIRDFRREGLSANTTTPFLADKAGRIEKGIPLARVQRLCKALNHRQVKALPLFEEKIQAIIRLERGGTWVKLADVRDHETLLIRVTRHDDASDKTILLRPLKPGAEALPTVAAKPGGFAPQPSTGPYAYASNASKGLMPTGIVTGERSLRRSEVKSGLRRIDAWLCLNYRSYADLPRHLEVRDQDCVIVDGLIWARAETDPHSGTWLYRNVDAAMRKPAQAAGWEYGMPYMFMPVR